MVFGKGVTKQAYIALKRLRRPKQVKGYHCLPLGTPFEPSQLWLRFYHSFDNCPAHSCGQCAENSTAKQWVRIPKCPSWEHQETFSNWRHDQSQLPLAKGSRSGLVSTHHNIDKNEIKSLEMWRFSLFWEQERAATKAKQFLNIGRSTPSTKRFLNRIIKDKQDKDALLWIYMHIYMACVILLKKVNST